MHAGLKRAVAQGKQLGRPKVDPAIEKQIQAQLRSGKGMRKIRSRASAASAPARCALSRRWNPLSSAWPREADGAQIKLKCPPPDVRFTPKSGHCIAPQRMSALCQKRTHAVQQIPGLATIRLASRRAKERTVAMAVASAKPARAQQGVMLCAATPAMIATQSQPSGIQAASFRRTAYSGSRLLRFRAHGFDASRSGRR